MGDEPCPVERVPYRDRYNVRLASGRNSVAFAVIACAAEAISAHVIGK